jgi:hypothetical protein
MCFAHSGMASDALHVQTDIARVVAAALTELAAIGSLGAFEVTGSGTPEAAVPPPGDRILDGSSRVMQNRWNRDRDLPAAITVRPGRYPRTESDERQCLGQSVASRSVTHCALSNAPPAVGR